MIQPAYYFLGAIAAVLLLVVHVVNVTRFLAAFDKRLALLERDVHDIRLRLGVPGRDHESPA